MLGWAKRDITEETRRPAVPSDKIPTYEKPRVTPAGFEPGSSWSFRGHDGRAFRLFASHQGEPGSITDRFPPDFSKWETCQTMLLVGGFSRGSPTTVLHSGADPYSPHFTLISSQDLDVKRRPNLFNHSHTIGYFLHCDDLGCYGSWALSNINCYAREVVEVDESCPSFSTHLEPYSKKTTPGYMYPGWASDDRKYPFFCPSLKLAGRGKMSGPALQWPISVRRLGVHVPSRWMVEGVFASGLARWLLK
ncbi:hypothetical protein PR048_031732 [Dryococelus australis]|uniref:Uncharacterized protein n=1 Tax=Dryococelus australis TaxID=614101 RepID=A0ABQ9G631_9NEOP|nr:hypothetical protein PR048_031732 [Dryococelus australis]